MIKIHRFVCTFISSLPGIFTAYATGFELFVCCAVTKPKSRGYTYSHNTDNDAIKIERHVHVYFFLLCFDTHTNIQHRSQDFNDAHGGTPCTDKDFIAAIT